MCVCVCLCPLLSCPLSPTPLPSPAFLPPAPPPPPPHTHTPSYPSVPIPLSPPPPPPRPRFHHQYLVTIAARHTTAVASFPGPHHFRLHKQVGNKATTAERRVMSLKLPRSVIPSLRNFLMPAGIWPRAQVRPALSEITQEKRQLELGPGGLQPGGGEGGGGQGGQLEEDTPAHRCNHCAQHSRLVG